MEQDVILTSRERMEISGVEEVERFTDGEIALVSMGKNGFSLRKKPQRSFERIAERITGKEVRLKFIK